MKILPLLFALLAWAAEKPLNVQLAGEPNTLDPLQVGDLLGFNIISNVAEGLMRLDGEGNLQHALAGSHTVSKNGLVYRFRLRPGIKWSDGKFIRAKDFAFGLQQALDPQNAARDAAFLRAIREVRADGEELVIELKQKDAALLQALTMPLAAPIREDAWRKNGNAWKFDAPHSGPYFISIYKPDREIRLEPNPHHAGKRGPPLLFKVIPEETTALNLFESGHLDILATIPPTEVPRLEKMGLLQSLPAAAGYYLTFNLSLPPFSDIRWRQAVAAAVDRESLAKLLPGTLSPGTSYLPMALEGSFSYSLAPAPQTLTWAKAQSKPEVSLVFASSAVSNLLMQRLQSDFQKKLGLQVRLEPLEWKAFLARLEGNAPAFFFMGFSAPFQDASSHLKLFQSEEPENRSRYKNAEYDRLVARMHGKSGKARAVAAEKAQRMLVERDVAVIPLLERRHLYGVAKGVKNFRINPYGVIDFRELRR